MNYVEALGMKGNYYRLNGRYEEARLIWEELNKYKHQPQTYSEYRGLASGCIEVNNYHCFLENYLRFSQLKPADYLEPWHSIYDVCDVYRGGGFLVLARKERKRLFELDMDSVFYYSGLAWCERTNGNFREALQYLEWLCNKDSTNGWYWTQVSRNYFFLGEREKAIRVILERVNYLQKEPSDLRPDFVIGYIYRLAGMKGKGDSILNLYIKNMSEKCMYPLPQTLKGYNHLSVARAYSILGEGEKIQ